MQKVQKKTLQLYEGIIIAYIAYFLQSTWYVRKACL